MSFQWTNGQNDIKQQADKAYQSANYSQAASLYSQLINEGYHTHELYYNLGCAYFRMDKLGLSILNFERALLLKPADRDTRANLIFANSRTQDQITPLPQFFLTRWWNQLVGAFTPHTWLWIMLVVALLLGTAIAIFMLSIETRTRRIMLGICSLTAIIAIITAVCTIQSNQRFHAHNSAIVTSNTVTVKSAPETNSTDRLVLHEGTKVTIDEAVGSWYRIGIADGNNGWVNSSEITRI